jgi:hypothetical protein
MNTINPIIIATIVTTIVAIAATSLIFFALTLYSKETISTKYSIAVFRISNPITKPIENITATHSQGTRLNANPIITTTRVVKR